MHFKQQYTHEMGSAWWQCAACLRTQEEDVCELQLNHCNLYDVPPDVFIYERTLEKLYLDANRVSTSSDLVSASFN